MQAHNELGLTIENILHVSFIYISNLFTKWVDSKIPEPKLVH
jgi:hypothetical protein